MFAERVGHLALQQLDAAGRWALFGTRAIRHVGAGGALGSRLARAIFELGVRCVPVIVIVSAFAGLVLGLQGHYVLSRFGASGMLGTLVSLSLCRESVSYTHLTLPTKRIV